MKRGTVVVLFVFVILTSGNLVAPQDGHSERRPGLPNSTLHDYTSVAPVDTFLSSDIQELQRTIDPVLIEQRGNKTTSTLHAETDSKTNVKTNLTIDTANDWVGSRASVNLFNLRRLYVENGSFTDGIDGQYINPTGNVPYHPYGWDAISGSPDSSMEMVSDYILSSQDVGIIAHGYGGGGNYFYANGSYLYWTQTVNNTPYLEDFILNFDYLYDLGPPTNPNITLRVYINDILIWINTTESITISEWYNSGNIHVHLPSVGDQFEFKIGMYLNGSFYHDKQRIGFLLDNVHLTGETLPTFDNAGISLTIGPNSTIITGTDFGQANITNPSFWQTDNVLIEFLVDLAYLFDYTATMLSHRFINSTRSTTQLDYGANLVALPDESPSLAFYTFIGVLPDINDFTLIIRPPRDWENASVYNPFGTVVTSSCHTEPGIIVIPNPLLSSLGWWEFHLESPNYLRNLEILKLNTTSSIWFPDVVYRSTNVSKSHVEIGGAPPIPSALLNVNITWLAPNNEVWFSELISGGTNGKINGSRLEFGSFNASAGRWQVFAWWTNGTELAFGGTSFEIHHRATLNPFKSEITLEGQLDFTNNIDYKDAETEAFLMNPVASIIANWSPTPVTFIPVALENTWLGTFDTSAISPGRHTVVVNAISPFFDNVSCTFNVTINYVDNDLTIDNPTAEIGIGDKYLATFRYQDSNGSGISGANVSVEFSGTEDGVKWTEPNDLGDGEYSIEFTAVHSDNYVITIIASKTYYQESEDSLFMLVGSRSSSITLANGTSAIISFGEQYRLVVHYTNGTGFGLDSANVTILSVSPATGIVYSPFTNEGGGNYSILLTPTNVGSYTLVIKATLQDYDPDPIFFTLTATTVAARLRVAQGLTSAIVGVSHPFSLLVFYEQIGSTSVNISDATLEVVFTTYDTLPVSIFDQPEGYLIQFNTNEIGRYEFTITTRADGYQDGAVEFTLFIRERAMRIEMQNPIWIQLSDLNITLQLIESDTNNSISGAVVTYKLYRLLDVVMEGYLNETAVGVYSVSIQPRWLDNAGYTIRIFVEKQNFALDQEYEFSVLQTTPSGVAMIIFIETYLPPMIGILAVSTVALSGRVIYRRKKKAAFAIDMANKKRFDDADNIIGVIVMHKLSGIPIYSRIVKGGFEEGIVAAFIAAVTHFREEFEILEEQKMQVIPISDIIRAVQTQNLICAFITVKSASIEHNRRMEAFGMQIATYLDDFYNEKTPQSAQDLRISEIIDYVYYETMDGNLLKFHKVAESASFPKRYRSIELVFQDRESAHCTRPIYLAKAVSKYGVSEARGCTLVSEVLEKRLLVPCEEHEIPPIDVDLTTFLKGDRSGTTE